MQVARCARCAWLAHFLNHCPALEIFASALALYSYAEPNSATFHRNGYLKSNTMVLRSSSCVPILLAASQLPPSSSAFAPHVPVQVSRVHSSHKRRLQHHSILTLTTSFSDIDSYPREDEIVVEEQLGYLPTNFVRVTSRTAEANRPVAIQTYPLNGGAVRRKTKAKGELTPFPTLYWLCCPEISRAVADLERRGFVGVLEERLRSDPEFTEQYIAAHTTYAKERWESLSREDTDMLERVASGGDDLDDDETTLSITKGMVDMIRYSGIAGRARPFEPCIKCLHSHYAHYRSDGDLNVVGMWTDTLLREQFPELDL